MFDNFAQALADNIMPGKVVLPIAEQVPMAAELTEPASVEKELAVEAK